MPTKKTTSSKDSYTEIEDIRNDLSSLKDNIVELTKHLQKDGAAQADDLKKMAALKMSQLNKSGHDQLVKAEDSIRSNPGKSVALAFGAGLIASLLLGRRGS